jgi:hypothetical protein
VRFARYQSPQDSQGVEVADSLTAWFQFLRLNKVRRLWNIAFAWERQDFPEHRAAAFAGGVPIAIQADLPKGFELWYPLWQTGGPQQKPWLVTYRALQFPYSHARQPQDLGEIKHSLHQALLKAAEFARRPQAAALSWAAFFEKALERLDSAEPAMPYHADILPESGFSLEARQLLAGAAASYVFGGMGSWNNLGFEDPQTQAAYEQVTAELYAAVKLAVVKASNAYQA